MYNECITHTYNTKKTCMEIYPLQKRGWGGWGGGVCIFMQIHKKNRDNMCISILAFVKKQINGYKKSEVN